LKGIEHQPKHVYLFGVYYPPNKRVINAMSYIELFFIKSGSLLASLHDHFNRAGFPSRIFSSQSKLIKKLSKLKKEKGLDEKTPR